MGHLPAARGQVEDGRGRHVGRLHVVAVVEAALAAGAAGAAAPAPPASTSTPSSAAQAAAAAAGGVGAGGAAGRAGGLAVALGCRGRADEVGVRLGGRVEPLPNAAHTLEEISWLSPSKLHHLYNIRYFN